MPENTTPDTEDIEYIHKDENTVAPPKQNVIKRFGCGLLVILWFTVLLLPCALFYLAANGEIRIWQNDVPEPYSHPRLLIELVSEVDYRGLRFVNSSIVDTDLDDNALCVQTNVSYFLWETVEDNQDVAFCDCYVREDIDSIWTLTETIPDICNTKP